MGLLSFLIGSKKRGSGRRSSSGWKKSSYKGRNGDTVFSFTKGNATVGGFSSAKSRDSFMKNYR